MERSTGRFSLPRSDTESKKVEGYIKTGREEGVTMKSMQEHLTAELGALPDALKARAESFFATLLTNLNCQNVDPAGLTPARDMSARDRIISYLDQLVPNLWETELGREVERGLNAILLNIQSVCGTSPESAR